MSLNLECPPSETKTTERMVGSTSGDVVRLATGRLELVGELGEGSLVLDAKGRRVETDVAAHETGELDVADLLVTGVVPLDPVLLNSGGLETELCSDGRHGAGVVGLNSADGDEGIGALGLGLSGEVPVN